jgi:hypothetical protein
MKTITRVGFDPAYGEHEAGETGGNNKLMSELVMKLMDAKTNTHVLHLGTRSYAVHMALNSFYNDIGESADSIAEAWQGSYEELLQFPDPAPLQKDAIAYLRSLRMWIDNNRDAACDDSEIQNLIDEAVDTIDGTLYKLRFLS